MKEKKTKRIALVRGRNEFSLKEEWGGGKFPSNYKGVSIHGFPNFFLMLGPGSGLGHNSVVTIIEW